MAGLGSIGACAIGGAGEAAFALRRRLFRLAAVFDGSAPAAALFDKGSSAPAVFDKNVNIPVSAVTEE